MSHTPHLLKSLKVNLHDGLIRCGLLKRIGCVVALLKVKHATGAHERHQSDYLLCSVEAGSEVCVSCKHLAFLMVMLRNKKFINIWNAVLIWGI